MRNYKLEDVNKRHSSTWTACNDDSKSKTYRAEFLLQFGGEFVEDGRYLKWQEIKEPEPVYIPRRLLRFIGPDNKLVEIDHMTDFCKQRDLSLSAMYDVLKGSRRIHKGYTAPPGPINTAP